MRFRANPVEVEAREITAVAKPDEFGFVLVQYEDGRFSASREMTARYMPKPGDFLVTQINDGYTYLNPREVFQRKYSPLEAYPPDTQRAQFHALIDAAENFNSDLTNITGRDVDDKILFVAVFARGDEAARVDKLLASQDLDAEPSRERHIARHEELHKSFDELLADFLTHNPTCLPSNTSIMDLIKWSHAQTLDPTETA